MNLYEQQQLNRRRSTWLIVGFICGGLLLGLGLDGLWLSGSVVGGAPLPVGTIAAVAISSLSAWLAYRQGDRLVLASSHAVPLDVSDPKQHQWQNVVEEMAIAAGLPTPKMYVIPDDDPNAFATGRDPQHASVAVTRGALARLNRDELQGVAAHEFSHIRNYDTRLMLLIAVLIGAVALISDWASRSLRYGGVRRDSRNDRERSSGGIALVCLVLWLVAVILAPLLSQLAALAVSRRREYLADASGAELTRNPLGLAGALAKIEAQTAPTRAITRGTAHLCITDPQGRALTRVANWWADLWATHPPMDQRIARLREMAYAAGPNAP